MIKSATQQRMEAEVKASIDLQVSHGLQEALDLMRRAHRYVSVHPTIGGQRLGEEMAAWIHRNDPDALTANTEPTVH